MALSGKDLEWLRVDPPLGIARVGNADPGALLIATAAAQAVEHVGLPEAKFALAQTAIYLSLAPKSNGAGRALAEKHQRGDERAADPRCTAPAADDREHRRDGAGGRHGIGRRLRDGGVLQLLWQGVRADESRTDSRCGASTDRIRVRNRTADPGVVRRGDGIVRSCVLCARRNACAVGGCGAERARPGRRCVATLAFKRQPARASSSCSHRERFGHFTKC